MKQKMTRVLFFPFLVVAFLGTGLPGCKGVRLPTGKGYTDLCQTYVGESSQVLIDAWGYPGRTYDAQGGKKVYVYVETKDEYTLNPLAHSALIEYPPIIDTRRSRSGEVEGDVAGQTVSAMDYCITYFELDQEGKIIRVFWKGTCKSLERSQDN